MTQRMSRYEAREREAEERVHDGAICPSCHENKAANIVIGNESQTARCLTCDRDYYLRAPRLTKD